MSKSKGLSEFSDKLFLTSNSNFMFSSARLWMEEEKGTGSLLKTLINLLCPEYIEELQTFYQMDDGAFKM